MAPEVSLGSSSVGSPVPPQTSSMRWRRGRTGPPSGSLRSSHCRPRDALYRVFPPGTAARPEELLEARERSSHRCWAELVDPVHHAFHIAPCVRGRRWPAARASGRSRPRHFREALERDLRDRVVAAEALASRVYRSAERLVENQRVARLLEDVDRASPLAPGARGLLSSR